MGTHTHDENHFKTVITISKWILISLHFDGEPHFDMGMCTHDANHFETVITISEGDPNIEMVVMVLIIPI